MIFDMKLYSTPTSPFVRIVRLVADRLDLPLTLIDVRKPIGMYALQERAPLWLVPVAEIDGEAVFDSRVIAERLLASHPAGRLWRPPDAAAARESQNEISVAYGALDAFMDAWRLYREGISGSDRLTTLEARGRRALEWLEQRLEATSHVRAFNPPGELGLPEIVLYSALDWLRFREVYPVDIHAGLARFLAQWEADPGIVATLPAED